MHIKGNTIKINKSAEELFNFLSSSKNYETLMPDNKENFTANENSFTLLLKGVPELKLDLDEKNPFSNVVLKSAGSKFNFTLTTNIKEISENECEAQVVFDGKLNALVSMIAKKPLTKFVDTFSNKLSTL